VDESAARANATTGRVEKSIAFDTQVRTVLREGKACLVSRRTLVEGVGARRSGNFAIFVFSPADLICVDSAPIMYHAHWILGRQQPLSDAFLCVSAGDAFATLLETGRPSGG
jgi:hypothetical protein